MSQQTQLTQSTQLTKQFVSNKGEADQTSIAIEQFEQLKVIERFERLPEFLELT